MSCTEESLLAYRQNAAVVVVAEFEFEFVANRECLYEMNRWRLYCCIIAIVQLLLVEVLRLASVQQ